MCLIYLFVDFCVQDDVPNTNQYALLSRRKSML